MLYLILDLLWYESVDLAYDHDVELKVAITNVEYSAALYIIHTLAVHEKWIDLHC